MDNMNEELLKEINERLIRIEKNQIQGRKIRIIVCAVILVLLIILAAVFGPRLATTLNEISTITDKTQEIVEVLDEVDFDGLKEKVNVLAGIDADKLQGTIDAFESTDFEQLQESITSIENAVSSIQGLLNLFK